MFLQRKNNNKLMAPQEHAPSFAADSITDKEFAKFAALIFQESGINLTDRKKELLRTRSGKRMRQLGLRSFSEYYRAVTDDPSGSELVVLLDAISTNLTSFFREDRHFEYIERQALPRITERRNGTGARRLRIWSAGCSTGEEPYSIAIITAQYLHSHSGWDVKLLATDISTKALDTARRGVYRQERLRDIPQALLRTHFLKGRGPADGHYRVKPELQKMIVFRRLNLIQDAYPFRGTFDVIFCRNVMIYFDKPTQAALVNRLYRYLDPGGYLFIGHSESLAGVDTPFKFMQPTIYQKAV